jgi:hypothetical protein
MLALFFLRDTQGYASAQLTSVAVLDNLLSNGAGVPVLSPLACLSATPLLRMLTPGSPYPSAMGTRRPNQGEAMRINFKTSSVPTRAAKRLKSILSLKESTAREWTAQVFGYRNWHELIQSLDTEPPSAFDEDCSREEVRARRRYHSDRLASCMANHKEPLPDTQPSDVVATWRPTSQCPHIPVDGWFAAPIKRFARRLVLGDDELPQLEALGPAMLSQLPPEGQAWLKRDACSVARKLLRDGNLSQKNFARQVLEELHSRGSRAGTLHLATTLMRVQDGAVNHQRAGQLFATLLENPETPPNIRAVAAEGRASLDGQGSGWPEDLAKAEATWEERARNGDEEAAYRLALMYDPLKPQTREAPANPAKAVSYYRMAALAGHPDARTAVGLLLAGSPDLGTSVDEGIQWLMASARQGDGPARELMDTLDAAEAWVEALPDKVCKGVLHSLMEKFIPQSDRGEPVVVPELGELVFIPPTCWIQLSTGALFAREGEVFAPFKDGRLAPDIVASYPRGPDQDIDRAGWVISISEMLNRFLPYLSERTGTD